MIEVGARYQHYKGNYYKVIAIGRHSEDHEEYIVYQGEYDCPTFGSRPVWVRPISLFQERITIDGIEKPRFCRITE